MGYVVEIGTPAPNLRWKSPTASPIWATISTPVRRSPHDGRVTLFAWMGDFSHPIETQESGWSGQLALPRDLGLNAELELTLPTSVAEAVELCFSTLTGTPFATVGYDSLAGPVFLRRVTPETRWSTGYRAAPAEGDTVQLRIVRDVSSIEVFIGDCSSTISSFVFSPEENEDTAVTARAIGADAELTDVNWWELESS